MASSKLITKDDIIDIAEMLQWEPAMVAAVLNVECNWPKRRGFDSAGRLRILWERHVCWRYASRIQRWKLPRSVCNPKPGGYPRRNKDRWKQLETAKKVMGDKAYLCASYGLPQIMGFNYKRSGYDSAVEMVRDFEKGERNQIEAFARFIMSNRKMWRAGRDKNFKLFARLYNGPKYYKNKYDLKLRLAYNKYAKQAWVRDHILKKDTRVSVTEKPKKDVYGKPKSNIKKKTNNGIIAILAIIVSILSVVIDKIKSFIITIMHNIVEFMGNVVPWL